MKKKLSKQTRPDRFLVGYPVTGNWVYGRWQGKFKDQQQDYSENRQAIKPMTREQAEKLRTTFHGRGAVVFAIRALK